MPLVLAIVRKQKKEDFQSIIMPALMPLIASAGAETMMHILRGADTLLDYMPRAAADGSIIPLIARAFDSGNATLQVLLLCSIARGRAAGVSS